MAWPAGSVNTTNADAGGDSPAAFRTDVLDLIQKMNQIIGHVTGFVQGLLSSANAPAARATLGAAASGANSDITSLTALTGGTPLPTALMPLGAGQAWTNMGGVHFMGTNYNNGTGRPILVAVGFRAASGVLAKLAVFVDGVRVVDAASEPSSTPSQPITFLVPAGSFYSVSIAAGSPYLEYWTELR